MISHLNLGPEPFFKKHMPLTLHFGISKCHTENFGQSCPIAQLETLLSETAQIINESVCFDFFYLDLKSAHLKETENLKLSWGPI